MASGDEWMLSSLSSLRARQRGFGRRAEEKCQESGLSIVEGVELMDG